MEKKIRLPVQVINLPLLDEQCRSVPGFFGINSRSDGYWDAIVDNAISEANAAQIISISLAHNPTGKSSAEVERETMTADVVEMAAAKADAALAQIDADIAILDGTPTNAQVVQILKRSLQREKVEIKVMRWLKKALQI